ncbi:MAG: transcriptional regulator [Burkholderiales bacterium PBB4]|nr:MAG: transcriptional regulator [Burkholderiales bacterium PBB4]
MSILNQLIALRKAQRLTQAELATRAAMTRMTVQRIESSGTDPRLTTVEELAKALGLELMLVPQARRQEFEALMAATTQPPAQPAAQLSGEAA